MPTIVLRLFLLEALAELVRASELSPDTTGSLAPILVEPSESESVAINKTTVMLMDPGIDAAVQVGPRNWSAG